MGLDEFLEQLVDYGGRVPGGVDLQVLLPSLFRKLVVLQRSNSCVLAKQVEVRKSGPGGFEVEFQIAELNAGGAVEFPCGFP